MSANFSFCRDFGIFPNAEDAGCGMCRRIPIPQAHRDNADAALRPISLGFRNSLFSPFFLFAFPRLRIQTALCPSAMVLR